MILTTCAACAAPLAHDHKKRCSRCKTRYCNEACQRAHWETGGHEALCRRIKRGGGAEQYHADKKYNEAVAVAVEACADDTRGQTCYICLETFHSRTGEGLVRGCACGDRDGVASGSTGVAHVSCLAEQAKILLAEAEENNLDYKGQNARWAPWHTCGLCEQMYHGVVACALGWACWKTYLGRPEADQLRCWAMGTVGDGLLSSEHYEDALSVYEAELSMQRRLGSSQHDILTVQANLATTYEFLRRSEEALRLRQGVYSGRLELNGEEHEFTLIAASNIAMSLVTLERFEEAKSLVRKMIPVARRVLGESDETTLRLRWYYAQALYRNAGATLDELREAVTVLEDSERTARRVFGGAHPLTACFEEDLRNARAALRARETE